MKNISSSLLLFGAVIGRNVPDSNNFYIDQELGVVIAPSAMHLKDSILSEIKSTTLQNSQLNNTSFYKSWKKVQSVTLIERLRDQILHYFTTYGLMSLGLDSPEYVYIPTDEFATDSPKSLKLRVIKGISRVNLITSCFKFLNAKIALQQDTIQNILNVLSDCEYIFTGNEKIANREAKSLIVDLTGILPKNGEELFRYLIYSATKESLIVKNSQLITNIKSSRFDLDVLITSETQIVELSKSFHRYKPLWLAFKFNKDNSKIVNRIAKLAKVHHVPLAENVLGSLTSKMYSHKELTNAMHNASIFQILRAISATKLYLTDNDNRYYKIRNGKSFAKTKPSTLTMEQIQQNLSSLLETVKTLKKDTKIYTTPFVDYAVPVSEKMFSGNIPKYTKISIPYEESQSLLVGVYWKNTESHSDLDLSAVNVNGKIGWNSRHNGGGLSYSGDVTSAHKGASEWLYCHKLDGEYLIKLNRFSAPENQQYKIIIGYGDKINSNYMIDPNKILFSVDCVMDHRQKILGLLKPNENNTGVDFYLIDQFFGEGIVSSYKEKDKIAQSAILSQSENFIRLSDIFTITTKKEDADVILEPNELSKDSILNLFV
jgi:hypothetical protein